MKVELVCCLSGKVCFEKEVGLVMHVHTQYQVLLVVSFCHSLDIVRLLCLYGTECFETYKGGEGHVVAESSDLFVIRKL